MERFTAEYIVKITVSDIFVASESTDDDLKKKIKEEGQKKLGRWVNGILFDPDHKIISEEVIIKHKGI